jgi:hypothetical protein
MARGRSYKEKKNAELFDFEFKKNHTTIVAMTAEDFVDYAMNVKRSNGYSDSQIDSWLEGIIQKVNSSSIYNDWSWQRKHNAYKLAGTFAPVFSDFISLSRLAADLQRGGSAFTKYTVKVCEGKTYISFKGYAGLRKHITGTRFLLNNPSLINVGIGTLGAAKAIKGGLAISIICSIGYYSLEQLLNDKKTWHDFVAGITVDTATALAGGAIVWSLVCVASGSVATLAIGPLLIVVLFGGILTFTLNMVANHYKLADRLAAFLKDQEEILLGDFKRGIKQDISWSSSHPVEAMQRAFGIPSY